MISNQPRSERPQEMREQARGAAKEAGEKVKEGAVQAREQAKSLVQEARERGRSVVDKQKHQVAERLRHICHALHSAADDLHEQDEDAIADYTERISENLESAAEYLDEVEVDEVIDNVESFGRRQPALFIGGMFLAGIAAARFLKASGKPRQSRQFDGGRMSGGIQGRQQSEPWQRQPDLGPTRFQQPSPGPSGPRSSGITGATGASTPGAAPPSGQFRSPRGEEPIAKGREGISHPRPHENQPEREGKREEDKQ